MAYVLIHSACMYTMYVYTIYHCVLHVSAIGRGNPGWQGAMARYLSIGRCWDASRDLGPANPSRLPLRSRWVVNDQLESVLTRRGRNAEV